MRSWRSSGARTTVSSMSDKIAWQGRLISVQPRITLSRSFDIRYHNYLGYVLGVDGTHGDESGEFLVAVGKSAHEKYQFRTGIKLSGLSAPVLYRRAETAPYYKTSGIKILDMPESSPPAGPPFPGIPPDLPTYRERGHRRLDPRTYGARCSTCIWGCRMPVEMIIDQWNPSQKKYRFETFCYGPKSCKLYKAGQIRKVPGRKGMVYEEEDWVDEEYTAHRAQDD
jgi:hypothetical protein